MANEQGMFGLTPYQAQEQERQRQKNSAVEYAKLDPFQRANMGIYSGAAGMVGGIGGMLGYQTPAVQQAEQRQNLFQGVDLQSVEGLNAAAKKFSQAGFHRESMMLGDKAEARRTEIAARQPTPVDYGQHYRKLRGLGHDHKESLKRSIDHSKPTNTIYGAPSAYRFTKESREAYSKHHAETGVADQSLLIPYQRQGKLGIGQHWVDNPNEDGTQIAEFIPGSKQYITNKREYAGDIDKAKTAKNTIDLALKKIAYLLDGANEDAFNRLFGGWNSYLFTQHFTGKAADAKAKLTSLGSHMKAQGKQMMTMDGTSIGQITEKEWPIMNDMIEKVDALMSEGGARDALKGIEDYMKAKKTQIDNKLYDIWSGSQFERENNADFDMAFDSNGKLVVEVNQ